jgi:hypothetical protein
VLGPGVINLAAGLRHHAHDPVRRSAPSVSPVAAERDPRERRIPASAPVASVVGRSSWSASVDDAFSDSGDALGGEPARNWVTSDGENVLVAEVSRGRGENVEARLLHELLAGSSLGFS